MMKTLITAGAVGFLAVPALAVLVALGVGSSAVECIGTSAGGPLAQDAPVPTEARAWVAQTKAACPDLPEAWIAAVMAQESDFRPDAYADDANGGTWGLFQINESIWTNAYGAGFDADLNADGVPDITDPMIHARVGGQYLCGRLAGVREIRAEHPGWASSQIPVLDALIIAHNAGESRLRTYPDIPAITEAFIANVHQRVAEWSTVTDAGARSDLPIDELKLDRSFTFPMADDARAAALVASTIDLAHSLGLRMVAEGVETDVAYTELTRLGCDQAQGYFMSRPVPAAELDHWLSARRATTKLIELPQPRPAAPLG